MRVVKALLLPLLLILSMIGLDSFHGVSARPVSTFVIIGLDH